MKTITIREAREVLSHPEHMFAGNEGTLAGCLGKPVARILPVKSKPKARTLEWLRDIMPYQKTGSDVLVGECRDAGG